ncbi:M23 family metallopeptidase [Paenibacillus sp. BSR1-1]|uniref:peptidoglycan DD-metalloendopeptidase family protein n=1 Tax=Paenibacillus sp. BSR1-1 TaxID=3020845 RepID=UPI0025B01396|nr:M23 family metallopeptidase [Paenibacillus sp. BSR1-1]MDN3017815.1 M23 family metallopeptidase [Paenibacillus sp. BSR1-1]
MFLLNTISKTKKLIIKTTIITTLAASVVALGNRPIALAASPELSTVYHVYLNGTYVGNVTDKAVVDRVINEKVDEFKNSNTDLNLGSQVEYIPEQVFNSSANNLETIQNFKNTFQLQAEAAAIVIDGKPAVYVADKNTAEEVIKDLKLKYVTEDQLKDLEDRKAQAATDLPPLKENETRLMDVRLSKNVTIQAENIEPDQILSASDAVTLLQKGTLQEKKYAVQDGDTLESIAHNYGLKVPELLALNPSLTAGSLLKVGQEINVTVLMPYVEVVVEKEVNQREVMPYTNQVVEDSSMPKGETKEKQQGQDGYRTVTYFISEQNGTSVKKTQTSEQILQQPVNHIVIKGTKAIPSRGEGSFAWPTVGGYVSSQMGYRWGKMHKGIDIARPSNKTIKAADNGVVVSAGYDNGGYGNKVIIDHKNGFRTLYGHMSSINVKVGQTVSKGTAIGIMGATGDATGVHLHFEVFKNGSLVNPLSYLRR